IDGLSTFYYGIQMRIVSLFAGLLVLGACGSAPGPTPEPAPGAAREAAQPAQPAPPADSRPNTPSNKKINIPPAARWEMLASIDIAEQLKTGVFVVVLYH